jgi:hypothetical protein
MQEATTQQGDESDKFNHDGEFGAVLAQKILEKRIDGNQLLD